MFKHEAFNFAVISERWESRIFFLLVAFVLFLAGFCTDPGSFDNGKVIGDDYSYNSLIGFQCNSGYDLLGPASLTCKEGIWDGRIPVCKSK